MAAGAIAGKVSGAGGGGVITFLVEPTQRVDVIRALEREDGRVINCHFTKHGSEGWKIFDNDQYSPAQMVRSAVREQR